MNYCLNDHYYYIKYRIQTGFEILSEQVNQEENPLSKADFEEEFSESIKRIIEDGKLYLESLNNYPSFSDNDEPTRYPNPELISRINLITSFLNIHYKRKIM